MEHLRARLDAAGVTGSGGLGALADGERCVVAGLVVARQHPATTSGATVKSRKPPIPNTTPSTQKESLIAATATIAMRNHFSRVPSRESPFWLIMTSGGTGELDHPSLPTATPTARFQGDPALRSGR
jgi:hypothetical protein